MKTDGNGGTIYASDDGPSKGGMSPARRSLTARSSATLATIDLPNLLEHLQAKLTDERLEVLAETTGVPAWAWKKLAPGWADADDLRAMNAGGAGWPEDRPTGAWVVAEHGGNGAVVGFALRAVDGRKGAPSKSIGARRGLVVPDDLHESTHPILLVEGASDVAACAALGLAAVGRPSNRAGADDLAVLLDGCQVLVVGERDDKPGGAWPGRDGAKATAVRLAAKWGEPVTWTLAPLGAKDIRAWLVARLNGGLDLTDPAAVEAARTDLLNDLNKAARAVEPERQSTADVLVTIALELFRLGRSLDGEVFAVEVGGPNLAVMLHGNRDALRARLAREHRQRAGRTPSGSALNDAMLILAGEAQDCEPELVALRVAELPIGDGCDDSDGVIPTLCLTLDLGDSAGRAVIVAPGRWSVVDRSEVLFRRSALTAALPEPARGGNLADLRPLLNVTDDTWPLVVGWLVAALIPGLPHPILMLGGEQGVGKSTAARLLLSLVDPSPAPLRSEPRDAEAWAVAAAGSWAFGIDNVSRISTWWSDLLCRAVTGDGWVRRRLYTDSDLAVLSFRRVLLLTSIDVGALRGDLGDRLVLVDLEPIDPTSRRTEAELDARITALRPMLLGGLLDAVAATLARLPDVKLKVLPRMADFARVLAALDEACPDLTGGRALELFVGQRERIARDVLEADPVAAALLRQIDEHGDWSGTADDLRLLLTPRDDDGKLLAPRNWPKSARGMSASLRRVVTDLRALGIKVTISDARSARGRIIIIERSSGQRTQQSQQSHKRENRSVSSDCRAADDGQPSHQPSLEDHEKTGTGDCSDGYDGCDGSFPNAPDRVKIRI